METAGERKILSMDEVGTQPAAKPAVDPIAREHSFRIIYRGETPHLEGDFVVRRPGIQDTLAEARIAAGYCAGTPRECFAFDRIALFEALAVCKVRVVSGPEWFMRRLGDVHEDVVFEVAREARQFAEDSFRACAGRGEDEKDRSLVEILPAVGAGDRKAH